jgi:hypothetical protein
VCAILVRHGFVVPDHRELRVGTLQSIIRQAGLPRVAFEID